MKHGSHLLDAKKLVVVPECYDAVGALLARSAGFEAVYISGETASASLLGARDRELLTADEMVAAAGGIASAEGAPVVVDVGNGYGSSENLERAVRKFERSGVLGIDVDDSTPPVLNHTGRTSLLSRDEAIERVESSRSQRMLVIARTRAFETMGLDEAIRRANLYGGAGADIVCIEGIDNRGDAAAAARGVECPLAFEYAFSTGNVNEELKLGVLEELGFRLAIIRDAAGLYISKALREFMSTLYETRSLASLLPRFMKRGTYNKLLMERGLDVSRRDL